MKFKRTTKLLSLILTVAILGTPLYGCANADNETADISASVEETTVPSFEEIFETVLNEQIAEATETNSTLTTISSNETEETVIDAALEVIDTDEYKEPETFEDFAGDMDVFVYGLLIKQGSIGHDFFNASIRLNDGTYMHGIAYTDYADYFEIVDKEETEITEGYFAAGFIPYIDECMDFEAVGRENVEGLEIINEDINDEKYSYVMAYDMNTFTDHCVVWNQYLKYGIDEYGDITYSVEEYEEGSYDKALGTLYSYDEKRNLYEGNIGGGQQLTGESLSNQIDYAEMQNMIDEIIDNQNAILANVDVETCVYIAQERINAYLLSWQEETFMGFDVELLRSIAAELDPMQCIQITPDGIEINDILEEMPKEPTAFVKWMTGIGCAIVIVATVIVEIYVPALTPLCGAVSGAAFEVFMEVIVENHAFGQVSWAKVGVAAASSAALAWICPAIASGAVKGVSSAAKALGASASFIKALAKLTWNGTLILANSVVGGAWQAANAYIDGESSEGVFNAFKVGAFCTGAMTAATLVLSPVATSFGKKISENKFINKIVTGAENKIKGKQVTLFKGFKYAEQFENFFTPATYEKTMMFVEDIIIDSDVKWAGKTYAQCMKSIMSDKLRNKKGVIFIDSLTGEKVTGDLINMKNIDMYVEDNQEIAELFKKWGVDHITFNYGEPDLQAISVYDMVMPIGSERKINFKKASEIFKENYSKNQNDIPEDIVKVISEYLEENNKTIFDLGNKRVQRLIAEAGYTYHEEVGMICLVPTDIHNYVDHAGGVYYAKVLQEFSTSWNLLDLLAEYLPNTFVGTYLSAQE